MLKVGGQPVEDPNWPSQFHIDTSTASKRARLADRMESWIQSCAKTQLQAAELDNLDS